MAFLTVFVILFGLGAVLALGLCRASARDEDMVRADAKVIDIASYREETQPVLQPRRALGGRHR